MSLLETRRRVCDNGLRQTGFQQLTRLRAPSPGVAGLVATDPGICAAPGFGIGGSRFSRYDFLSRLCCFGGLGECRDDFEEVADDADVGDAEDRRVGVFVDGDNASVNIC